MDTVQAIVLALLQGLTEFLPISSSAHLILIPVVSGWQDQGLAFDVAVHVGTLTAVVAYYRKDLSTIVGDWLRSLVGKGMTEDARLAWYVGFATIPVGLVGLALPDQAKLALRSPLVIAGATIVFALVLWIAERRGKEQRVTIGWLDVVVVGLFQAIALIPGTSRSGITITAGLLTGLKREQAARFSFLMSIPVIALAGLLQLLGLVDSTEPVDWLQIAVAVAVSACVAYLTIGLFLRLLNRIGMMPFVVYRLILGVVLLAVFL